MYQAIYATINHLGMTSMKLKSENIKRGFGFPQVCNGDWVSKQQQHTLALFFPSDLSFHK